MSEGNAVTPGSVHPSGAIYTLRSELLPIEDLPLAPAWAIEFCISTSTGLGKNTTHSIGMTCPA